MKIQFDKDRLDLEIFSKIEPTPRKSTSKNFQKKKIIFLTKKKKMERFVNKKILLSCELLALPRF